MAVHGELAQSLSDTGVDGAACGPWPACFSRQVRPFRSIQAPGVAANVYRSSAGEEGLPEGSAWHSPKGPFQEALE